MTEVEIRRALQKDSGELHDFFREVIINTFNKEGIGDKLSDIKGEIETKKHYLAESFAGERTFLVALMDGRIVGTIEFGPASKLITSQTDIREIPEVGTVFVHPDFQGKGISNLLLKGIQGALLERGIKECCLDSGYRNAQKIWKRKFGEPDYLLKDFWGKDYHHMIWKVPAEKLAQRF